MGRSVLMDEIALKNRLLEKSSYLGYCDEPK
jgi:hypothetical protein